MPDQPDPGHVVVQVDRGVATVTFGHPRGNSLPGALLRQLAGTFDTLATRDEARVVVLASEGNGPFCGGASFDELRAVQDAGQGTAFFSGFAHVILAMRRCPKFIIARVHGKAVGGGVGLVAASDYAVAASHAQVRLSELAIGIGPFVVGPAIEHRVGRGHFAAFAIDHDWRDATWARAAGLYARVEDSVAALDGAVESLARRLATTNPAAMARMKQVLGEGTAHWDTLLFERAAMSGTLVLSDYTRQAIAAFAAR
jgi:enoyl-CoA hydratase/carnithine racemase